ncbi:MAG: endolytic transglycosylase MltG [Nocardioides sp.]
MSEHESDVTNDPYVSSDGPPRRRRSRFSGCLPILIVLAIIGVGGYYGVTRGIDAIQDQFGPAEDFSGPGSGEVSFQVTSGDTISAMGRNLEAEGVVGSVEAFTNAAADNPGATGIQAGFYALQKQMKASDVVAILVDPSNIISTTVTIPEGLTVNQIIDTLAQKTGLKKKAFTKVLDDPASIGLPEYADGNPEGYLFPATYAFDPDANAEAMLVAMVNRWEQAADDADLEGAAKKLGYTPHELMTVASMVQAEGRGDDMPKVARVIFNRLEIDPNPTAGFLEIDATVNYALGQSPIARLTTDQIASVADSPYNTYEQKGLPPGPIEAPGDDAIAAAANPADGPWFFYVTVNLRTAETKFTDSFDEFLQFRAELDAYCATQSDRC